MENEYQEETLATPGVIDRYQQAGKVANSVLKKVIAKCVPGAKVVEITAFGDAEIETELKSCFSKKKFEKGLAFPTCISVNEVCGHYSPLVSDSQDKESHLATLKEGDVCKIDLGCHIDGYMGLVAHTIVVGKEQVEGRQADVILAAYNAVQASLRLLKPGCHNHEITKVIETVTQSYKTNGVEGVLSHDLKKYLIDGNNVIINKETFDQKVEDVEFQVNDVYALDVIVSTGEGKTKESELRTTVFKRALDRNYTLKTQKGRQFLRTVHEKYPATAFSMRAFDDEITAKLGVSDCMKHQLLDPYPVLVEKAGELVAHFKITVLLLQGGTIAITGLPIETEKFKTENKIEDAAVLELLATSMDRKSQKAAKKKKAAEKKE